MSKTINKAFPVATQSGGPLQGGLTKLEWMAGQVAAGWYSQDSSLHTATKIAPNHIAKAAAEILKACRELETLNAIQ